MGKIREATGAEVKKWDELLLKNPDGGEIFQSKILAELKVQQGWKPKFLVYETSFGEVYVTGWERRFLKKKFLYMPNGAGVVSAKQLDEILEMNKEDLKEYFAIRMEPRIRTWVSAPNRLRKTRDVQQNQNTIVLDLSVGEEKLWEQLRQNARRAVRKAEDDKVVCKEVEVSAKNMEIMYGLYRETGQRAGFFVRPKKYYLEFWKNMAKAASL